MNKYRIILIKVRFDGRKEEVLNTETSDYLTGKDLIRAIKEKGLRNRGKFVELRIIEKYVCGGMPE